MLVIYDLALYNCLQYTEISISTPPHRSEKRRAALGRFFQSDSTAFFREYLRKIHEKGPD